MKKHYRHEKNCLNCGTDLQGNFCHNCGQENLEMKESFGHMLNHAVSDYFHFDYQFFHTLKPLFTQPGKLTVDYLAGRRAQYLHPVKMYIFISLVFFVLFFKVNGNHVVKVDEGKKKAEHGVKLKDTLQHNLLTDINNDGSLNAEEKKKLKGLVTNYLPGAGEKTVKDTSAKAQHGEANADSEEGEERGNFNFVGGDTKAKTYEEYLVEQAKLPVAERNGFLMRYIIKKGYDWNKQGHPQEIVKEAVTHNSPKIMFVILPLFALILKVAFRKNHKLYVEHIIYSIHLHCFVFLFLTATLLLALILPQSWEKPVMDWVQLLTFIGIIWYVYRSFRVFYQRSRWRTVSKMIGVSIMYLITSVACFFVFLIIIALTSV
ncbi:DUF3667 domain-containing protein [Mucilaginibacter pedocola]|uniref:DUF3667 domain-containing protein n=1 Tax=Mucilaginibacter pedocola TaxID=1792845 RepID=A0A1S9PNA1_9SPHI|nr:DUF3667 domain-containing protein [Mucilaginibacter pedocola]OOQ62058.1 hypothetical protein BC343_03125 [Mucilaginibacter pedocola]